MNARLARTAFGAIDRIHLNLGIKKFLAERPIWPLSDGPKTVQINPVGIKCNHQCVMCWQTVFSPKEKSKMLAEEKDSLTLAEYEKLFSQLPFNVQTITVIGGGEPLVHPQIMAILKLIKKHNFFGHLVTNGALLDKEKIKQLLEMKWDSIRTSFHASGKDDYFKIHRQDDFDRVVQAIKLIRKLKVNNGDLMKLSLQFVIQKLNFDRIEKFSLLAEGLGVEEIEFENVVPWQPETLLTKSQTKTVIEALRRISRSCRVANNAAEMLKRQEDFSLDKKRFSGKRCFNVQQSVFITSQGDVWPCCFISEKMGNIRDDSFLNIWRSRKYKRFRQNLLQGQFRPACLKYCLHGASG